MTHDATQETYEEYLRRIHLEDKLKMEWKEQDDQEEKKKQKDSKALLILKKMVKSFGKTLIQSQLR